MQNAQEEAVGQIDEGEGHRRFCQMPQLALKELSGLSARPRLSGSSGEVLLK